MNYIPRDKRNIPDNCHQFPTHLNFGDLRKYSVQDVTTIKQERQAALIRCHIN